ncbi:MAG: integration host factor subunit beta [Deltaproteobacteria bacterium]|nr:integration host factor subunit beta [Deltaproteobacteria bacterium]
MTRGDLVDTLARKHKIQHAVAECVVDAFFGSVSKALAQGARVEVRGFGTFTARRYRGHEGRNPKTGAPITVRPKVLPFFKVGKELRERVEDSGR